MKIFLVALVFCISYVSLEATDYCKKDCSQERPFYSCAESTKGKFKGKTTVFKNDCEFLKQRCRDPGSGYRRTLCSNEDLKDQPFFSGTTDYCKKDCSQERPFYSCAESTKGKFKGKTTVFKNDCEFLKQKCRDPGSGYRRTLCSNEDLKDKLIFSSEPRDDCTKDCSQERLFYSCAESTKGKFKGKKNIFKNDCEFRKQRCRDPGSGYSQIFCSNEDLL